MLSSAQFTFAMCAAAYNDAKKSLWVDSSMHGLGLTMRLTRGITLVNSWCFVSRQNLAWNNVREVNRRV